MDEFEKVVNELDKKNLENLLVVSCITSAFDYFSGFPNKFPYVFPLVNQKNTTMFIRAIIYSRSDINKNNLLTPSDLPFVFNTLANAGDRFDIFQDDGVDIDEIMTKLFSSFACSQLLFTKNDLSYRIGIKYALYFQIPNKFKQFLKQKHKSNFVDIPSSMENILGINLQNYFAFCVMLLLGYKMKHDQHLDPTSEIKAKMEGLIKNEKTLNKEKEHYLYSIILYASQLSKQLKFRKNQFNSFSSGDVEAFLNLTSRDIKEIRKINREKPFQQGHISERLSPLERFPIVQINSWEYIIPNFRYFDLAITELLRWAFQEIYLQNEFNETMGSVLEMFLSEILEKNFKDITIIKEKKYKKKGSDYRGPDITLIEGDKLIAIEVKSKHITLNTRLSQHSDYLINDLSAVFEALQKLEEEKIPDFYEGLGIYKDYQIELDKTRLNRPICIVVIGEGVHSLQEYLNMYNRKNHDRLLSSYQYPFCIIDVIHFCKALDIARKNSISLFSLFSEYFEVGRNLNPKQYAAEDFGGRQIDWNISVLYNFWQEVYEYSKMKFTNKS